MNAQPSPPPVPQTDNKLAVWSLVLGVLAIIPCSILAGIPAVITGHIALNRAGKSPTEYGGKGLAVAGLVMGYLSVLMLAVVFPSAALLPALAKAKGRAQEASCRNNLKQIILSAQIYANDHNGKFPPDYLTMSNELSTPKILVCIADQKRVKAAGWDGFDATKNVSYEYVAPGIDSKVSETVVFRCPVHGNVALADGSVIRVRSE